MKEFLWEVTPREESGQRYLQGNAYSRLQELIWKTCTDFFKLTVVTFFKNIKFSIQNSSATLQDFIWFENNLVLALVQAYQEIHIKHANEKKKV